jgi:predicted nucleic acid-binding protein
MGTKSFPMTRVFLDTSYAVALASPRDHHHSKAVELAGRLERVEARIVTTRGVILEIGNSLSRLRYRSSGVALLESLETDPRVEIVALSEDLYQRGFEIFRQRHDKEWSLVDCTSFVVMQDRRLQESLTTDEHFEQAGFRALLREA